MEITSIIVTYSCCWWILFLMILPIGSSLPKNKILGHASSAPEHPMLLKKAIIATLLSIPLTFLPLWLVHTGKLSFLLSN
jgi:predicted secreted protein